VQSGEDNPAEARPLLFLSYSRPDLGRARQVIDLLEAAGFDVWWDGRLEGGENFLQTTEAALEGAACVVVLWSATSIQSHWVRDEAQSGRERGCLVPLSIDGTMAPLGFRQFQLLDVSGWNGAADSPEAARILVAVRAKVGDAAPAPSPAPAPVVPAPSPPATGGFALSRRALTDAEFGSLYTACDLHTGTPHHDDPTVAACFVADRLDLSRVGFRPDPRRMPAPAALVDDAFIEAAMEREREADIKLARLNAAVAELIRTAGAQILDGAKK
jgi:hypothetical protein